MSDREALNRAVSVAREFDNTSAEFLEHEFETYEVLREALPVARSESRAAPGVGAAWVLTRYADIARSARATRPTSRARPGTTRCGRGSRRRSIRRCTPPIAGS